MDETNTFDPSVVYATIVKEDDGFHVVDFDGTVSPVLKLTADGCALILTKNASNRKWFNLARAQAAIAENGKVDLYYKASKHFGPSNGTSGINKKLIAYLSDAEQAEINDIIARAVAARQADKKQPATPADKLKAKIDKLQAQYDALLAECDAEGIDTSDVE